MGKYFVYAIAAIFLAPVAYSVIMAFIPEKTASMVAINSDKSVKTPQKMYEKCAACHGANGDGSDGYPSLNTLGAQALYEKMVAFQNGSSGSTNQAIMKAQLEGMSNDDIVSLSKHISTFKPNEKMKKKDDFYKEKKIEEELDTTSVSS